MGEGATFGMESDGTLIAGVILDHYNGASACLHVAGEGNWLTREYMRVVFDYCFGQLKLAVILGLVSSANREARRFDEHLGFRVSTVIANACPDGDLMIYTLRPEDCRYWRT